MKREIQLLTVLVVVASLIVGASAFTTGSVERSSSVDVVSDDAGLIGLEDGTSGPLVFQNSTGSLEIDFTKGGAGGVNEEAHYELGNPSDPTNQSAFKITNNDGESHSMTIDYTLTNSDADADDNIKFKVYEALDDGTTGSTNHLGTVSENGDVTVTAASGQTYYVVVVVDTYGSATTDDLSGNLNVSV